jgi:Protein HRI1
MTAINAVPANYRGVWRRELLETATSKDDTSLVLWMQTQQHHIDIRIPANRPSLPKVDKLEDYTNEELLQLASQQGFAGITQVTASTITSSEICQWHREIDFQPPNGTRDIGKMVFTDADTVIETGVDESYLEVWRRLENSQQTYWFKLTTGKNRKGLEMPAYLMRAGNFVAYARPRQAALLKSTSLLNVIQTHKPQREQLLDWLDMEISFGEILDDKNWKVKHSTLPFKVQLNVSSESNKAV